MFDEKAAKVIDLIPLSNGTISRQIGDLAEKVKATLIYRIKSTKFSLQMDESTDVAGLGMLMVIVRYPYLDSFHEDLLLCKPLPITTTGTEIFKLLDEFFSENSILWDNCIDVCTDGAKAMTDEKMWKRMRLPISDWPQLEIGCWKNGETIIFEDTANILRIVPFFQMIRLVQPKRSK
ncbi:Zinc finger BED domain-containing protein 5 [Araneus ventricosus]|uniref:Zinc finger BED domain-containing protein 5 n=1 Tax=Araneus ventricosus TaxID=182803 RepID=A0A4Y2BTV5_ARAVE|nr:Zinc finger BED domain-containing protein 5 [Araneus ventricosus]